MWSNYFLLDMSRCKNRKKLAQMQNNRLFLNVFMRLFDMAMMRYKITGLPDTVNDRVILQSLICYGNVTFFNEGESVLGLPSVPSGDGYNVNGDPVTAWVFSRNGLFNKQLKLYIEGGQNEPLLNRGSGGTTVKEPTGFMVWENRERYPFLNQIVYYAEAIADTLRTIDVGKLWLKLPVVPVCEESIKESVTKLFKDIKSNEDIIPVSTGVMGIEKFDLKPTGDAVQNIHTAMELVDWYEMQYRALCGFKSNTSIDKKGENLIQDEVNINDSYTDTQTDTIAEYLENQLKICNNFLGTNIHVEINETMQSDKKDSKESEDTENE